jgi:hypothetical protein
MKKTYSTPEIQIVLFAAPVVMQSQSSIQNGSDDGGSGIAESKGWQGGFLWNAEEED